MPRLLACLLLLGLARAAALPAAPAAPPTLILISLDGYRADYLGRGHSPVLAALAAEGVRAAALRPAFPSQTYPNHYTLVTGLYPDHHGMINNTMHDRVLGSFTPPNRAANTDGRWWGEAEPLWVTAQKQGRRTASIFWPGTQAEIHGVRPSYWELYDPTVTPDARVDEALSWLDLPNEQRPTFISLYFEHVDVAGHSYGPDSPQVGEALLTVDAALGHLVDGLRRREQYSSTNLIIVSDHGMTASSPQRVVLLDRLVNLEHLELVSSLVNVGINPKPGYRSEIEQALLGVRPHMQCWKKEQMPPKFHYGSNARIPAIQCLPEEGWMISTAADEAKRSHPMLGEHGYDPADPDMRAVFIAHGPSFKQHLVVPELDNVNVYALLARVMGIQALPNDGNPGATATMLR